MIVRPLTVHAGPEFSCNDHDESVIRHILNVCGSASQTRLAVESVNVKLFLGFGLDLLESGAVASYPEVVQREYAARDRCWAHGLFLTVGPDATVYPCTEMNCDRRFAIGNLLTQSVRDVYGDRPRLDFLSRAELCGWGPSLFQPFSRTSRLDAIARAIRTGALGADEIEQIRLASLSQHPLMLN